MAMSELGPFIAEHMLNIEDFHLFLTYPFKQSTINATPFRSAVFSSKDDDSIKWCLQFEPKSSGDYPYYYLQCSLLIAETVLTSQGRCQYGIEPLFWCQEKKQSSWNIHPTPTRPSWMENLQNIAAFHIVSSCTVEQNVLLKAARDNGDCLKIRCKVHYSWRDPKLIPTSASRVPEDSSTNNHSSDLEQLLISGSNSDFDIVGPNGSLSCAQSDFGSSKPSIRSDVRTRHAGECPEKGRN